LGWNCTIVVTGSGMSGGGGGGCGALTTRL